MFARHSNLRWPAVIMAVASMGTCVGGLPLDAAEYPYPRNGDVNTPQSLVLSWSVGEGTAFHDIYFGRDANAVAEASPETRGVHQGRLACDRSRFDPGPLDWNTTYFWRIDEVNGVNPTSPAKGEVWRFTTADFLVIDDFERYTDERGERLYEFWIDGWYTGNGSLVGYTETPFYAEYILCHSGRQAMPFNYDNSVPPYYSEAYRAWETPQDWTVRGGTTLSLWVYGWPLPFRERQDGTIVLNGEGVWATRSEGFLYTRKQLTGDGATWQEIRDANDEALAVEIDMSPTVEVGLFVASNKYGVPAQAEFSGVAVDGDVSGSWQPEGINARLWHNDPDSLYVALEDAAGRLATAVHPDPNAVNVAGWTQWRIPLSDFTAAGVDLQIIARMYLGLGKAEEDYTSPRDPVGQVEASFSTCPLEPRVKGPNGKGCREGQENVLKNRTTPLWDSNS